jgi:glutathione S-transferase
MKTPILYSLARCPYAIRARIGLLYAQQDVLLRAIAMSNKPTEMLTVSPKGTVPVLLFSDGKVIDESLDIILWALNRNDPSGLLLPQLPGAITQMTEFVNHFETGLIPIINAYKEARRARLETSNGFRDQGEVFIQELEKRLQDQDFLFGENISYADIAIFPSIRQFCNVEKKWFRSSAYSRLTLWLDHIIEGSIFMRTMRKVPLWLDDHEEILFTIND